MARYYNTDPEVVEYVWTNADFLDRQEAMFIEQELERRSRKRNASPTKPKR